MNTLKILIMKILSAIESANGGFHQKEKIFILYGIKLNLDKRVKL